MARARLASTWMEAWHVRPTPAKRSERPDSRDGGSDHLPPRQLGRRRTASSEPRPPTWTSRLVIALRPTRAAIALALRAPKPLY